MLREMRQEEFDTVYALMETSFPSAERRPYSEQKALLDHTRYTIYVYEKNQRGVQGFLAVWQFADVAFLEHFAVDPSCRNLGIGTIMLQELRARLTTEVCLEVELPECETARRRIGFYERNGFFLNRYPYLQPPISEGNETVPLWIMTSDAAVDEERFAKIKETLYREVYGRAI